jgi:hypothetical protein
MEDAGAFTKHCIVDSSTIGSEDWCEKLADKPKGEWTGLIIPPYFPYFPYFYFAQKSTATPATAEHRA